MYLPGLFEETRLDVLQQLVREHPLGTWVASLSGTLEVNHVPFLIDPNCGELGTLYCHVARPNPLVSAYQSALNSVIAFQGPQSYVTPNWYPSKQTDGRVVPTWNYAVVHAYGQAILIDDRQWLLRHLHQLTDHHEIRNAAPWSVDDAPPEFIDGMVRAVVGVEIRIERLVGKWKVSQNRAPQDRHGVIQGLTARGDDEALAMADLVTQHSPPDT